jgi:hypothetical protein
VEILTPPALQQQTAGSLLAAANTPPQVLARAGFGGHGYQALAPTGWTLFDSCTGREVSFNAATRGGIVTGVPVAIRVLDECTTLGSPDLAARARALLAQVESAAIAREFWTGELAALAAANSTGTVQADWQASRHLTGTATNDLTPLTGPVTPLAGLARLEDAIGAATAGAPATVHMTRRALTHLVQPAGLRREGGLILTALDTRVVADAGYPGTGPTGGSAPTGTAWLYASARPTIWRSAAEVIGSPAEQLDRATNHITTAAEEYVLTALAHTVFAVRVTLES